MFDGVQIPMRRGTFEGAMCRPNVIYLGVNALRIVRLPPPRANEPVQRTRQMNAFAAVRCDKRAMRPFAKLVWSLDTCLHLSLNLQTFIDSLVVRVELSVYCVCVSRQ